MEGKLRKIIREQVRTLLEQSVKGYTVFLEGAGAVGSKRVMVQRVNAFNPNEAAKRALLNFRRLDWDPSNYSVEELQGDLEGENVYVLAVAEGDVDVPLTMTPHGLN